MNGSYRTADGKAQIDWTLTEKENGPEFSACGEFEGGSGQCLDRVAEAYPDDAHLQRMVQVWREYHLNGMKAGLPVQEAALREWAAVLHRPYDYDAACKTLKDMNLYEVEIPAGAKATGGFAPGLYRYGTRWVYSPIPDKVLEEIKSWVNTLPPLHEDQAEQFLAKHGLKFRAVQGNKECPFGSLGNHYRVTISRKAGGRVAFDFWGSQADPNLTPYDVLSCISCDVHCPDTFEDYCGEYGYDSDSREALATFNRCNKFAKRLQNFFSSEEIEELGGIQ